MDVLDAETLMAALIPGPACIVRCADWLAGFLAPLDAILLDVRLFGRDVTE